MRQGPVGSGLTGRDGEQGETEAILIRMFSLRQWKTVQLAESLPEEGWADRGPRGLKLGKKDVLQGTARVQAKAEAERCVLRDGDLRKIGGGLLTGN